MEVLRIPSSTSFLDDFGTGYSSLSYLQSFPFDKIKLDRSIASAVASEPKARAIVHAVVGLAKALGTSITAEGVETQEQLEALRQLGCDQAQGYLLGRPAPFRDIGSRLSPRPYGMLQSSTRLSDCYREKTAISEGGRNAELVENGVSGEAKVWSRNPFCLRPADHGSSVDLHRARSEA
jgi:hypothetical protein